MSSTQLVRNYPNRTKVMRRDGNVFVKVGGAWKAEHRLVAEFKLANRELMPGEKVCHKDNTLIGEDDFNDAGNLVIIRCRTRKWAKLKKSKVIYLPKPDLKKDLVLK
jgi:hypothetical protein